MSKTRNLSDLLDANGDVKSSALDNVPATPDEVAVSSSAPSSPSEGDLWFDTTNQELKVYYGGGENAFLAVSREQSSLSSVTGNIFNGTASTLTLAGTGFKTANLVVSFTPSGGSATNVTITPASETSASVAVPSAIYNLSASTVIGIKVTNSDNRSSQTINKTIGTLPTGGTITSSGGFRIHTFLSSANFVNSTNDLPVEYLVVAGGGAGGIQHAGGGGAGGFRTNVSGANSGGGGSAEASLNLAAGTYAVTIGAGGAKNTSLGNANGTRGNSGNNTTINFPSAITSIGGGRGGRYNGINGDAGGSGGGAATDTGTGGAGTSNQGYAGGDSGGSHGSAGSGGGGGGGAGAAGAGGNGSTGDGGVGVSSSIDGTARHYAGGGGGARVVNNGLSGSRSGNGGNGGGGGAGDGATTSGVGGTGGAGLNNGGTGGVSHGTNYSNATGGDGGANTGGGGGASGRWQASAGSGGSGIAIIRYAV